MEIVIREQGAQTLSIKCSREQTGNKSRCIKGLFSQIGGMACFPINFIGSVDRKIWEHWEQLKRSREQRKTKSEQRKNKKGARMEKCKGARSKG